jgi:outer membrane lipoprotein-sorting protein
MNQRNPEDQLNRSIEALRSQQIPSGPSQRVIAQTSELLSKQTFTRGFWQRTIHMAKENKSAAAIMLIIVSIAGWFICTMSNSFSSVSYGQVAEIIRSSRSMSFTVTATPLPNNPPVTFREMWMNPGKVRIEMPNGTVTVTDAATGKSISLNPKTHTAFVVQLATSQPAAGRIPNLNLAETYKHLADTDGQPAGEKQIGDVKAKGFRIVKDGRTTMVYVDPKTAQPLRVEMDVPGQAAPMVMSDFNFDANLDPKLFDLQPPADYQVKSTNLSFNPDIAQNIVQVLGIYAKHKNGQFPPSLNNWGEIIKAVSTTQPSGNYDEMMKVSTSAGMLTGSLFAYKRGIDWDYQPQGVKLGDADKIVFWIKPKGGASTYQAVYGDLHIAQNITVNISH